MCFSAKTIVNSLLIFYNFDITELVIHEVRKPYIILFQFKSEGFLLFVVYHSKINMLRCKAASPNHHFEENLKLCIKQSLAQLNQMEPDTFHATVSVVTR